MIATATGLPDFPPLSAYNRRVSAETMYRYLTMARPADRIGYDGDRTVTAEAITISYDTRAVEIRLPDPTSDDGHPVAVYVPGTLTFAPVSAVVCALLTGQQVTP
jgi:hypothetical protein